MWLHFNVILFQTKDLSHFAEHFKAIKENLKRIAIDIGKKIKDFLPAQLPKFSDFINSEVVKKMKVKHIILMIYNIHSSLEKYPPWAQRRGEVSMNVFCIF